MATVVVIFLTGFYWVRYSANNRKLFRLMSGFQLTY